MTGPWARAGVDSRVRAGTDARADAGTDARADAGSPVRTGAGPRGRTGASTRVRAGAVLASALALAVAGCSDDGGGTSPAVSRAASAAESVGAGVSSEASVAASRAGEAAASATASAAREIDRIENGADARAEVTLGTPAQEGGRTNVRVRVRNTADATRSFAVEVDFVGGDGKVIDVNLVTVRGVPAGGTADAVARSSRTSGKITARVPRAVRY